MKPDSYWAIGSILIIAVLWLALRRWIARIDIWGFLGLMLVILPLSFAIKTETLCSSPTTVIEPWEAVSVVLGVIAIAADAAGKLPKLWKLR
jgi:hypothetical protein